MIENALRESYFLRLTTRAWKWFIANSPQSFLVQKLLDSTILQFLGARMPLTTGLGFAILFAIPHALFNNLYSLFIVLFLTVILYLEIVRGRYAGFRIHYAGLWPIVFLIAVCFAALGSYETGVSLRYVLFYLTAVLAFILCATVLQSRRDFRVFLLCLLSAVSLSGLYGCYQALVGVPLQKWQVDVTQRESITVRVFSFFDNPNNFAEVLILALPFFAALFFLGRTRYHKMAVFLMALPPALSLVLTNSRSGWGAFCLGMALFFALTYRFLLPIMCVAALAAIPLLPASIQQRIISAFTGTDTSILYRSTLRDTLMPMVNLRWLQGSGLGSETVTHALTAFYEENYPQIRATTVVHAHNIFLQLWAELGLVGAASFGGMVLAFFRKGLASLRAVSKEQKLYLAAGLGAIAGIMVMGLVEHIWFYPRIMLLFWIVASLTLCAARGWENKDDKETA